MWPDDAELPASALCLPIPDHIFSFPSCHGAKNTAQLQPFGSDSLLAATLPRESAALGLRASEFVDATWEPVSLAASAFDNSLLSDEFDSHLFPEAPTQLGPFQPAPPYSSAFPSPVTSHPDSDSSTSDWDGGVDRPWAFDKPLPTPSPTPATPHFTHAWRTMRPRRSDILCGAIGSTRAESQRLDSPDSLTASHRSERRDSEPDVEVQPNRVKGDSRRAQKMHECAICGKRFPRPSGLATHMNTHSGAKPFKCPILSCDKSFAVRSNAKRHLRTHGVYPAPDVAFGYLAALADTGLATPVARRHASTTRQRWVPQSLLVASNCDWLRRYGDGLRYEEIEDVPSPIDAIRMVDVPLPPVVPSILSEGYDASGRYEERNSYAGFSYAPYHPSQWQGLPGPAPTSPKMSVAFTVFQGEPQFFPS